MLIKLTDANGQTRGGTQWGPGVTNKATGKPGQELCTDGWIHAYEHRLVAVLMDPEHGNFGATARMWEAEGRVGKRDGQLKCGCLSLTTVREIPLPQITIEQRVRFAIACSWPGYDDAKWRTWARKWLSGEDRSAASAARASRDASAASAASAAWAAWDACAASAAWAAWDAWAAWAASAASAGPAGRAGRASSAASAGVDIVECAAWCITDKAIEDLYPEATC
jgi:hypothetical protein